MPGSGTTWDTRLQRPRPAPTDEIASTTGMPAMMIAPNTTSRIASVTGRLSDVAVTRSPSSHSWNSAPIDPEPTCSTRRPGCSACTSATTSCRAATRSLAVSASPARTTCRRSAEPSSEGTGPRTSSTSSNARKPLAASVAAASASPIPVSRALTSTFSRAGSRWPASDAMRAASPDSPTPSSSGVASRGACTAPIARATAIAASHSTMALARCVALHVAMRCVGAPNRRRLAGLGSAVVCGGLVGSVMSADPFGRGPGSVCAPRSRSFGVRRAKSVVRAPLLARRGRACHR